MSNGSKKEISAEMLNVYGSMLTWLFIATVFVLSLILIPTALIYYNDWQPFTLLYVVGGGALGGFISSLTRLYGLRDLPALLTSPNFKLIKNRYVAMYALVPPLIGIVASTFFYLLMITQLFEGNIFPKMVCTLGDNAGCDRGVSGLFFFSPETIRDTAKALIWGFISGFTERFLPDVIKKIDKS